MCIDSIDFKEDFDNISHGYLFQRLETYGFSTKFQWCIRNMYGFATSSVQINGHRIGKISFNCAVLQGCPLSMQLFAICINPLLCAPESTLQGQKIGHNCHKATVIACADHVTVFLKSPAETS
jgi:hypothetical protein